MKLALLCGAGFVSCLVLCLLAILKVGSRADLYQEKLDNELTEKHNELLRKYVGRINQ